MPDSPPSDAPKRPQKAFLRRTFGGAERAIGGRIESLVQRSEFALGISLTKRVDTRIRRLVGNQTGRVLHALSIPTVSDVRRVHQHLSAVDAHLSELVREQEFQRGEAAPHGPRRPPPTDGSRGDDRDNKPTETAHG